MVLYADSVWMVNTLVDFLMLMLAARLCGYCARPWRCFCGAALGGVYAVITLLPGFYFLASAPWQLVFFLLMAASAYGLRKKALRPAALAYLCSFALAGFLFLLLQYFPVLEISSRGGLLYPAGTRILLLLAGAFYLAAALMASGSMRHSRGELHEIRLKTPSGSVRVNALHDTGNSLRDPLSGKPVVVLCGSCGKELLGFALSQDDLRDAAGLYSTVVKLHPEHRFRLIPYRTVGISTGMLLAAACVLQIGNRKESVFAALSPHPISDGGSYEALIGGILL